MIIEYLVIFLVILAIVIIYAKNKKKYALATIPLLILPGINIAAYLLSGKLATLLPFEQITVYTVMNIAAALSSVLLVGIWSNRFHRKSTKVTYVVMCLLFNIILACIFVYNEYMMLFPDGRHWK